MGSVKNGTLGAFSVSLSVSDIGESSSFYEKLGFEVFGGDQDQNWLIMRNGPAFVGLFEGMFEGMFEGNLLTFNPGWSPDTTELTAFSDIRDLKRDFESSGLSPQGDIETDSGPASFFLTDPDGNQILIDQHV